MLKKFDAAMKIECVFLSPSLDISLASEHVRGQANTFVSNLEDANVGNMVLSQHCVCIIEIEEYVWWSRYYSDDAVEFIEALLLCHSGEGLSVLAVGSS